MTNVQTRLCVMLIAALALSWISPIYPNEMLLQHIPTVIFLIAWPIMLRKYPLSNAAAACLAVFMLLHILGARYIYSYVPYDEWSMKVFGVTMAERFGFSRNHFDRVVHFSFGLLWTRPVWEIVIRYFRVERKFAYYTAFEFVLAFSMLYELVEWGLSIVLAGPHADAYNGQQGDMWDAQKDMSFATLGSLLALIFMLSRHRWELPAFAKRKSGC